MRHWWIIAALIVAGCTTDTPVVTPINGHSTVQTTHRFVGIPVWTSNDEARTAEQKREKIELDKERREVDLDLKAEERQQAAMFYGGILFLGAAAICVVIGYITNGWKFWGGLALVSACIGMTAFSLEHIIPYLKWFGFALVAACVGWTMWKAKDWSLMEYWGKRKQLKSKGEDNDQ